MVNLNCPLTKNGHLFMFLLEFKQVMGKTYEFTQARNAKHFEI
jgi:hypothetical protein